MSKPLTLKSLKAEVDDLREHVEELRRRLNQKNGDSRPRRCRLFRLAAKTPRLRLVWPASGETDR